VLDFGLAKMAEAIDAGPAGGFADGDAGGCHSGGRDPGHGGLHVAGSRRSGNRLTSGRTSGRSARCCMRCWAASGRSGANRLQTS
jgi:hypothetical protein